MSERVIGIDLGTTNSCVATVEGGEPRVIPVKGKQTTPSMVAITASGRRIVGALAKRQMVTNATGTVHSAKRIIGRPFHHEAVKAAMTRLPYQVVPGQTGDARIGLFDKVYTVPEISALVLKEMKEAAEAHFGAPVDKAVITVPAYFNDGQRQATKDAGRIAGLDVLRIISEPTAAALAYGHNKHKEKTRVAVFDLGGGTFDVSVLDISGGTFEVVATSGDTYLGGDDFDQRIVDWLLSELKREHGVDPRGDVMVLQRMRDAAEKAKIELSLAASTTIGLPFLYTVTRPEGRVPVHLERTLTRAGLEQLVADLIKRSIDITAKLLEDAKIPLRQIGEVVLVGGMTHMPAVKHAVNEFFGITPAWNVNPDEVVALGAAVQASALMETAGGGNPDLLLLDVTPHNLGIMIAGGYFRALIPANSTVPTCATHVFSTVQDQQTSVKIVVLQGASDVAANNELLGEFTLSNLPAKQRGGVEIEVTFDISAEGIVCVSGRNLETGAEQSIEVTANDKLSEAELQRIIRESNRFAVADKGREEELIKTTASLVADVERLLPNAIVALSVTGRDQEVVQKAQAFLAQTRRAAQARDLAALDAAQEQLTRMRMLFDGLVTGAR
ncbi:MAG: molecular chaperone DnaK [Deltaproteobacteria bacterium]|nr:molecular chaperone DnaK [Deltaproteobacteria bacterium]